MTRKSGKKNTGREKEEMNTDQKGTKKNPLQTILKGTHSVKEGSYLLSRIALQYHRR